MKMDWRPIEGAPDGERVFLLLAKGEKGNGELAVGMVFPSNGPVDCYWTWGGPNSGSDVEEVPVAYAPLPDGWQDYLSKQQKGGMRPMNDAPRDGTPILLASNEFDHPVVARWHREAWDTGFANEIDGDRINVEFPIGWHPLP